MELPFAVEASDKRSQLQQSVTDSSSLVTASSQGSLMESDTYDPILPKNPPDQVSILSEPPVTNVVASSNNNTVSSRVTSALSHFGVNPSARKIIQKEDNESETIDFTYVNVWETDEDEVDIIIAGGEQTNPQEEVPSRDILSVLLSGNAQQNEESEQIVSLSEEANQAASRAAQAKKEGNLQEALDAHTAAAKLFQQAAIMMKECNASMATSLLLLSQTHAKSALAIKRVVKLRPNSFAFTKEKTTGSNSQKDRLRATVRGALDNRTEEDISDSAFLGRATAGPTTSSPAAKEERSKASSSKDDKPDSNPVDEMMELERELRDMDMALELGNSIASLDARTQNRMKNSIVEGSFMVVTPGSNSYMSSSTMWGGQHAAPAPRSTTNHPGTGTAGVRARANRVQNILEASSTRPVHHHHQAPPQSPAPPRSNGLESSWWGNASTASQVLASSVVSLASSPGGPGDHMPSSNQTASTKQLMQLMDSLKTLGDENAALLREVEGAEQARMEAKAAKEQIRRFKEEYAQRFAALKAALEKFRKGYPEQNGTEKNPVTSSEYVRTAVNSDQLQRQEQLIRKLTADLKKEKEESKKKDGALRKYESFYREVKARSAQKAAQRQKETQQRQQGRTGLPPTRR